MSTTSNDSKKIIVDEKKQKIKGQEKDYQIVYLQMDSAESKYLEQDAEKRNQRLRQMYERVLDIEYDR